MQSTLELEGERRGGVLNGSLLASTGETEAEATPQSLATRCPLPALPFQGDD